MMPRSPACRRARRRAAAQAQNFGSPELIEAAKKEGKLVLLHGELHRGRAGDHQGVQQALSRDQGRDGARAGRPAHHPRQDRGGRRQAARRRRRSFRPRADAGAADLFQDYAPPNAADYLPDAHGLAEALAARHAGAGRSPTTPTLVKNPPKTWMDLTKPEYEQADRPGHRPVRRHHLDPRDVRAPGAGRGLLEEAGRDPAGALSLGRAAVGCAGARRGLDRAAALQHRLSPSSATARRSRSSSRPRACRSIPMPPAFRRPRANPNAAKLFLNWCLSEEGQTFMIKELGNLTSLKTPPVYPQGFDPQGGEGLAAEVRRVREAARDLGRGVEQDLRLSPVKVAGVSASSHRDNEGACMSATLDVRDLRKQFAHRPAGRRRRELSRAGRRDRGAARPLRLRQDHDAALRRRPRASDVGRISIGGRLVSSPADGVLLPPRLRNIGMVFQSYAVWPHMTVRQNVAYPLRTAASRAPSASARSTRCSSWSACRSMPIGRWCRSPAARCSAWRWRAASSTSRSCCCSTSRCRNLDAKLRLRLRDDLRRIIKQTGVTALYVTHDQAEAVVLGDRIGVMRDGKLLQMASAGRDLQSSGRSVRRQFHRRLQPARGRVCRAQRRVRHRRGGGQQLTALLPSSVKAGEAVKIAVRPENVRLGQWRDRAQQSVHRARRRPPLSGHADRLRARACSAAASMRSSSAPSCAIRSAARWSVVLPPDAVLGLPRARGRRVGIEACRACGARSVPMGEEPTGFVVRSVANSPARPLYSPARKNNEPEERA